MKLDERALDHRRFWDAMDLLLDDDLAVIETQVFGGMIVRYGLDLASLDSPSSARHRRPHRDWAAHVADRRR